MKKAECEAAIRHLCTQWGNERNIRPGSAEMPSFSELRNWLHARGYSRYLEFRSTMGPLEDAERWFDEEFKQTWRN